MNQIIHFLAKYYFMKAFIVGQRSDKVNFERELQLIADKFPETDEGKEAVEIIAELNKNSLKDPKKEESATENHQCKRVTLLSIMM